MPYRISGGDELEEAPLATSGSLTLVAGYGGEREFASFSGEGFYVGGQAGAALGYKKVFFGVELTMVELISSGRLDAFGQEGLEVEIDSFIVYPSFGLMGEF